MTAPVVWGPTFAEMRNPNLVPRELRARALAALEGDPLNPVNLYNITWHDAEGKVVAFLFPRELSGVDANILVLSGRRFPGGSPKVGAVYSILIEKQLAGDTRPGEHTIVCPSTGNYGIGGAWVGPRMNYASLVVLPAEMSRERFEKIKAYGAQVIATPGCESNVKEIFDKVKELRADKKNRVLEQFSEFGNYRFHYGVTGPSAIEAVRALAVDHKVGNGRIAAFVSAMGSAGTIAAGDRIKDEFPAAVTVGLEPVQCPTLYSVGFGGHAIEGIGDKHVTWIHNVKAMDFLMCIDDQDCLRGLQLVQEGTATLVKELGVPEAGARELVCKLGVSGICNVLGSIKTAKLLGLGRTDTVVTVATDAFDRYPSVLARLTAERGPMTEREAVRRAEIFRGAKLDWVQEGTRANRERWHNQKYFTWVEQQGKTVEELNALAGEAFWARQRALIPEIDAALKSARGF
ncbi:MAG: pyridoxal-phosphate dependent enzyme [Planctomycetes bacterium]|nr:pyridoxal-phosphate dependent enzyme [Planctomycetota bacterium]